MAGNGDDGITYAFYVRGTRPRHDHVGLHLMADGVMHS